ncbi:MAG: hypothetical protein AB7O04_03315 [Hyphomonadaceae bacterium]
MFATLALVAMAVRAFVPAGFMSAVERQANFPLPIVLCTGHAVEAGAVPSEKGDRPEHAGKQDHAPCVFAAAAALAAPEQGPAAHAPALRVAAPPYAVAAVRPGRGLAAPPPWPTGPPLNA